MQEKSLKQNYALYLIKTSSSLIFPIITFAYVSRVLSVEGIGKVDFSRSIVSYFTLFAMLGIPSYGIREGAKLRNDKEKLTKLTKELLVINCITTLATYVCFFISLICIPKFRGYLSLMLISGLGIAFTALGVEWLYSALEEYGYITIRTVLFQAVSLLLLIFCVKSGEDYNKYACILLFSTVGANVFNFIHAKKFIDFRLKTQINLRHHLGSILIFFSNGLAGNIYLTLDTSMVGILSTDYAVGLYSAANKMNRICLSIVVSISTILLPRLSYYISSGESKKYRLLLKRCFNIILMLSLPIACGMFILSKDVLLLFGGEDFVAATNCSKIMSAIILFIPLSAVAANQILIPFGKEKYQLFATIMGAASNLVANLVLIPRYAEVGAAIGTVISEFMVCAFSFIFARRCLNFNFVFGSITHYLGASLVMCFVIWPLQGAATGFLNCILSFLIGSVSYFVALFIMKDEIFLYIIQTVQDMIERLIKKIL